MWINSKNTTQREEARHRGLRAEGPRSHETSGTANPTGTTEDPWVLGAGGGRGDQDWLLNGHGVSGDENVLERAAVVAAVLQLCECGRGR